MKCRLPTSLVSILDSEKVGCLVDGELEFGSLCSASNSIPSGTLSLSSIALRVLDQSIEKDERESNWSGAMFANEQIRYAAWDAWASLAVFKAARDVPEIGSRINSRNCVFGTFVSLKPQRSKHAVASGYIEQAPESQAEEKNSCLLRVYTVNIPGYMVKPCSTTQGNQPSLVPLSSFTESGFVIEVAKADLNTASRLLDARSEDSNNTSAVEQTNISRSSPAVSNVEATSEAAIDIAFNAIFQDDVPNVDKNSFKHGYTLFSSNLNISNQISSEQPSDNRIYSRVVKDVFHLVDMIKPYKQHGLYKEFVQRFSDSLFVLDENDKEIVSKALAENGESWEMKLKHDRTWLWERVKRKISSPSVLIPVLQSLFLSFGPLRCSKSGRVLFDKVSWSQALSVLKTVQLGHVSDPPGVQLYYKKGKRDKYGLTLYRCVRGTNSLEGGVHQNLIRKFDSFGAGPELTSVMLVEYRLRHNFDVGTLNRFGVKYKGHCKSLPPNVSFLSFAQTRSGLYRSRKH